jgi:hypothetical protein
MKKIQDYIRATENLKLETIYEIKNKKICT